MPSSNNFFYLVPSSNNCSSYLVPPNNYNYGSYIVPSPNNNFNYLFSMLPIFYLVRSPNKYGSCPVSSPENHGSYIVLSPNNRLLIICMSSNSFFCLVPSPDSPGGSMSSPINLAPSPNNHGNFMCFTQ